MLKIFRVLVPYSIPLGLAIYWISVGQTVFM